MRIGVYGYTDKRPVIYALLKLLHPTGDVALFSNHRHYKRLLTDKSSHGHMANIMVCISDSPPMEHMREHGYKDDDFEHIVFDLQDHIVAPLDMVFYVKSFAPDDKEQAILEQLNDPQLIKFTYDGKREKGAWHIVPQPLLWKRIEQIETYRILAPIPAKELNKNLALTMAASLGLKNKVALKLLNRRWKE